MPLTKSDLKKGANRYTVITEDGQPYKVSADSAEEAQSKVEQFFGAEVFKVTLITAWRGGEMKAN